MAQSVAVYTKYTLLTNTRLQGAANISSAVAVAKRAFAPPHNSVHNFHKTMRFVGLNVNLLSSVLAHRVLSVFDVQTLTMTECVHNNKDEYIIHDIASLHVLTHSISITLRFNRSITAAFHDQSKKSTTLSRLPLRFFTH